MIKQEVKVTRVNRFNFKDEESGKSVSGTKIVYDGQVVEKENVKGIESLSLNGTYEAFEQFTSVPGYYEIGFEIVPGPKGAAKMQYVSCKLLDKKVS